MKPTPRRDDEAWYASLLRESLFYKFTLAVLLVSNLFLGAACFYLFNRVQPIYAFDSSTGRTYATSRISTDMFDNLLIAASRNFIGDFLNYDHLYIERARANAYARMSPVAQRKFKETIANPEAIMSTVKAHRTSSIRFIQEPRVILRAGNEYRTFCIVEVTIRNPDGAEKVQQSNWKLSWIKHISTPDRPDGLWLSNIENVGADELNQILNQIK